MERALGESRQKSQTSGWGKSLMRIVKSDRQPNTTVSKEPTVLANLGFLNSGVIMKEKKICQQRRRGDGVRSEVRGYSARCSSQSLSTHGGYPIEEDEEEDDEEVAVGEEGGVGGDDGHHDGHDGDQGGVQETPGEPVMGRQRRQVTFSTKITSTAI